MVSQAGRFRAVCQIILYQTSIAVAGMETAQAQKVFKSNVLESYYSPKTEIV
jgi:hypothetical protein